MQPQFVSLLKVIHMSIISQSLVFRLLPLLLHITNEKVLFCKN